MGLLLSKEVVYRTPADWLRGEEPRRGDISLCLRREVASSGMSGRTQKDQWLWILCIHTYQEPTRILPERLSTRPLHDEGKCFASRAEALDSMKAEIEAAERESVAASVSDKGFALIARLALQRHLVAGGARQTAITIREPPNEPGWGLLATA